MSVCVWRPSRMSGSGLEALPDVWEWSGGPPGCPVVVGKPSWMSGRPSRMSKSGREALADVREWSGGPAVCPVVVGRPSLMSGSGR